MLGAKSLELLNYLQSKDSWTTSSQLSLKLNVSLRSIKNYVSEIKKNNSNLIISSRKGYKVNEIELLKFLKTIDSTIPQTPQERIVNGKLKWRNFGKQKRRIISSLGQ